MTARSFRLPLSLASASFLSPAARAWSFSIREVDPVKLKRLAIESVTGASRSWTIGFAATAIARVRVAMREVLGNMARNVKAGEESWPLETPSHDRGPFYTLEMDTKKDRRIKIDCWYHRIPDGDSSKADGSAGATWSHSL